MPIRQLTEQDVKFSIDIEPETDVDFLDDLADCGNKTLVWVDTQLRNGNLWAWCCVKVTGEFMELEECEYLGACSYKNEEDFKVGGYYADMKKEIIGRLQQRIEEIYRSIHVD